MANMVHVIEFAKFREKTMGLTNEQAQKLEHDLDTNHTEMIVLTLQDANRLAASIGSPHAGSTQAPWLCPRTDQGLLDGGWGCTKSLYQSTAHQWVNTNWVVPTGLAAYDTFKLSQLWKKIGGHNTRLKYTVVNGKEYVIITGRPGLRTVLNGTRYLAQNAKLIQVGVGKYSLGTSAIKGFKISAYVAIVIEVFEYILSDESVMSDLFVGVGLELVKAGIATAVGYAAAGIAGVFIGSAIIPVAIGVAFVFAASYFLNVIDNNIGIKSSLKEQVRLCTDYAISNLEELSGNIKKIDPEKIKNSIKSLPDSLVDALMSEAEKATKDWFKRNVTDKVMPNLPVPEIPKFGQFRLPKL
ncbi:Uncharacterized protein ALO77_03640 [Pseudomonas coronafaciens pv. garcae]|nr:Uncharacterized protein ALO77_03640 [Pseudomonas coronafaciens pv. garcae]RMV85841.1 hypothetical protein ALP02_04023 [Pseudomonas coronafaciens pv. garcae]